MRKIDSTNVGMTGRCRHALITLTCSVCYPSCTSSTGSSVSRRVNRIAFLCFNQQLSNGDHTNTVVRNALDKHGVEGDPDEFELAQQLPDSGKRRKVNFLGYG